jgi:hypothetical protein
MRNLGPPRTAGAGSAAHTAVEEPDCGLASVACVRLVPCAIALVAAAVVAAPVHASQAPTRCTMAVPATRATVEATIANAADFCELMSQALASEVFGARVLVTPGRLWHYAGSTESCELQFGHSRYLLSVRNSLPACRWLTRPDVGWHPIG